jgi:hypothetical protein
VLDVDADVAGHLGPPVIAGYELEGLEVACMSGDTLNTTQTLECTKDKYNVKIKSERVSPKVSPTTYIGRRIKERSCEGDERVITK